MSIGCGRPACGAGKEAAALEAALGIPVLRHADKKPSGGSAELAAHFGCAPADLIMVGDRWVLRWRVGRGDTVGDWCECVCGAR